jgi:hypothetical protein
MTVLFEAVLWVLPVPQKIKDTNPVILILGVEKTSAVLGACLVFCIKLCDIRKNFKAINSHEKIKKTENLILGVARITAISCTFFALYSAYFLINRPVIRWAVIGSTLILNPKDTLIPFIRNKLQKSARILPRTEAWSERASLNKLPSSEGEGSQAKGALNFEAYF